MIRFLKKVVNGCVIGLGFSLFLFLIVPSCQTMNKKNDKKLQPYINTFLDLCSKYKKDCSRWKSYNYYVMPIPKTIMQILFPNDFVTIGRCNRINNTVIIDEKYFNSVSFAHIESTVIHELGHCVLRKPHIDEKEVGIMNPYSMTDWLYVKYYQKLMDGFFECKKKCPKVSFNLYKYEK